MSPFDAAPPDRDAAHPLSSAQQEVWLGQLFAPDRPSYTIGCVMSFEGTLRRDLWEQAIATVVARHDALRMVLVEGSPLPYQRVLERLPFSLPWHDYTTSVDGEARVQAHIQRALERSFVHYEQPLWDIQWLQATPDRGYCLYLCHHLALDGVSLGMLSQQVVDSYNEHLRGESDPGFATPSFLRALEADLDYLVSSRYQRDLLHWRARLGARPAPLYPSTTGAVGRQPVVISSFALEPAQFQQLTALADKLGGSFTTLVVACLASCLSRLSAHSGAIAFGLTVHNRHNAAERSMLGMLSTQLPISVSVPAIADLAAAMHSVAAEVRSAMRHARFPLRHALQALNGAGPQAPRPFDISVSVEDFSAFGDTPIVGGARTMRPLHGNYEDAALGIVAWRYNATCPTTFLFNVDPQRLPLSLARRLLSALRQLLLELLNAPHTPLSQLPLLSLDERAQLDLDSASEERVVCDGYVHHAIARQAQRTPQAIAVVDAHAELSYADLDARANQLAHHLIALGIGPEVRVAVCLPRGIDLVVALLAVLKAGGAYVPLDPIYPAARLAFMLQDSGPQCLLTHRTLAHVLPDTAHPRVWMDDTAVWTRHATHPAPLLQGLRPQHLAYVLYTSGSTGRPKGVMVCHQALMQFLAALQTRVPLAAQDRLLAVTTVCFDIAGLELFAPLLHGARVVIAGDQASQAPSDWMRLLDQHAISVLQATPGFWQMLLGSGWQGRASLRMLSGGEALSQALANRLRTGGGPLWNLYGPTEATIWASTHPVDDDDAAAIVPLGRALPTVQLYVLDPYRQRLPLDVAGELYIAGEQLARGYLGRPDLTAERFLPDPFAARPGQRMYRTGDIARLRADGTLDYLGRNDDQVKLRGVRIELGEIAAALRACAGVRDAVVVPRQDNGERRLVAYLVGDAEAIAESTASTAETIRSQLAIHLPEIMLPSAYVWLPALPLTTNGKLERSALPAPDVTALAVPDYVAPSGERETHLAALWCELLGVERVGRHDDFFALGGHSLLGVKLIARLRSTLGVELPLATVFACPRLVELTQALEAAPPSALPAMVPVERSGAVPLSFAQRRLWVLAQLDARADLAYLMPGCVVMRGTLDTAALQWALDRILARHEALRTRFVASDDGAVQVIGAADSGVALERIDLRQATDPEAEAQRRAEQETLLAFDLQRGPLLRAQLLQLADDEHRLLVTLHHLIADGWSIGVLLQELGALYTARVCGHADPLPALPIQYADYTLWQHRWIDAALLQRQCQFWLEHLRDAPVLLTLPSDRARPPEQDYAGAAITVMLDAARTQALLGLSQRHGTTLFMTLLATWGALLARLAGQDQVVIGTPIAQRNRAETAALIGLFVNTQALHIDLRGDPSVAALLAQVRDTALAAQEHQDLPFEQLIEALQPVRSLAHAPVFQVMFSWQNTPQIALTLPGLHSEVLPGPARDAKYDLELDLQLDGERIVGSLRFATALFDAQTVQRHWESFGVLLDGLLGDAQTPVSHLPLLAPSPSRQQAVDAHTSAGEHAADNLVQWFAQQAAATPRAIAVVEGDNALSYQQLECRANRLAHQLVALGARPDHCVGLCLQRGLAQIVAVLAVLKTGAAYLPLEPNQPNARITAVVAEAKPLLVLVDQAKGPPAWGEHVPVVAIERAQADAASAPDSAPLLSLHPEQLAYVIYTSGSSGRPKGVMVAHHGLRARLAALIETYGLGPQDRVLQFATLAFDASVEEIFGALCSGATLVLRDDDWLDTERFWSRCAQAGISVVDLPTRFWAQLCAQSLQLPDCVRQVIVGGEALTPAMRHRWLQGTRTPLLDTYGPTEAIVVATTQAVADDAAIGIGRPLPGTQAYVLDRAGHPLPHGGRGTLHLGGAVLARGYLGRPDLTAERFVPDPFAATPGTRMYATGDLACWRGDGSLSFLGRKDRQLKLRGFRIEPSEIETALLTCPDIEDAVVLPRERPSGEFDLVAYVVGAQVETAALRDHLRGVLPDYMLPAAVVRLDALPLTPNGKLDRRALPAPDHDALDASTYVAPEGALEVL
ncbi:non-ribosomal peptide synthetase, partial [Xanthomonas maliensis]|uniref:non-ribosomal peptide synthetase n=2 Tax=Xanthomonas maliensis TaxID=1321368 RepID=UPI001479168B